MRGKIVKIIVETALLTKEEIAQVCAFCLESGVDFVKTSTGLYEGANLQDIQFMKEILGDKVKIKASGGIRNLRQAQEMIKAGATRIGTSSGVRILSEKDAHPQ